MDLEGVNSQQLRELRAHIVVGNALDLINAEIARRGPDDGVAGLRELVEAAGLKVVDTALPQPWVDEVVSKTGQFPYGFVWSYDGDNVWGAPHPLTPEAHAILVAYDEAIKSR